MTEILIYFYYYSQIDMTEFSALARFYLLIISFAHTSDAARIPSSLVKLFSCVHGATGSPFLNFTLVDGSRFTAIGCGTYFGATIGAWCTSAAGLRTDGFAAAATVGAARASTGGTIATDDVETACELATAFAPATASRAFARCRRPKRLVSAPPGRSSSFPSLASASPADLTS